MSSDLEKAGSESRLRLDRWRSVLHDAAREVFLMMVGSELSAPEQRNPTVLSEVAGMVGLAGELCGVLTIRCTPGHQPARLPARCGTYPKTRRLPRQPNAVGEVCSMVAGSFKAKIAGLEGRCMLSVPTVISGDGYELHSLASGERIDLPLMFQGEPLWFSLDVQS
jgi:CheY-specific phosphatase CheX